MWFLGPPDDERVGRFLAGQAGLPFTYPHVGATGGDPPAGYDFDHNRARLGAGRAAFDAASDALRRWKQFPTPWIRVLPAGAPLAAGQPVAVVARAFGRWWLNAARVVYTVDEASRFGLAYGTLPGHVERGEERFLVEWLPDDSVWYDLRAFSQPRHPLARLGYPLARRVQRRFARESLAAMAAAVTAATSAPS
jgi:uncharacterized protein (UPF0548 family)